jgi:putative CocE/NonD family hydrolase
MSEPRSWPFRLFRLFAITLGFLIVVAGVAFWQRLEILRIVEDLPPFSHEAAPEQRLKVEMHDGVKLATIVRQPAGAGPWPVVLLRNPYARFGHFVLMMCDRLVRYGYACVYQDVRGQGDSEGEWDPLVNEPRDGSTTLHWIAAQPFQDGNIAMMGPSYLAAVQWAAAGDLPPEVKTLIPSVIATNTRAALYQDGMFRHETFTAWAALLPRRGMPDSDAGEHYASALRHRPHVEVAERFFGGELSWYRDWVSSPHASAPLWSSPDVRRLFEAPASLEIPILMIGGWYDIFIGPQFDDWHQLASRSKSRFVVGPWNHIGMGSGDLDMPNAGGGLLQWKIALDWLGHHLRGEPLEHPPGVATYVVRENRWAERREWPPPTEPLLLHLTHGALVREEDEQRCTIGLLSEALAREDASESWRYDPDDPVPTRGGAGMLAFILPGFAGAPPGNVWQPATCSRSDVLSFVSPPFEEAFTIAGRTKVSLSVASSAPDTAFTAKLMEVLPDGRAVNIRDGITSLAYRNGADEPLPYRASEAVDIEIELWPIEWQVQAGSRLRLDVSSSDFPKYHVHPNRAGLWSEQTEVAVADQTLYTGVRRESWVELPVLPRSPIDVAKAARLAR